MIDLSSNRWGKLQHAYGNAADIPGNLKAIEGVPYSDEEEGPWLYLYSSLCHQFEIDTASYAAFPHIVLFAENAEPRLRFDYLSLASTIEAERCMTNFTPRFPQGLKEPYFQACEKAAILSVELLREKWSLEEMGQILGIIAVFHDHPKLGFSILGSSDEIECRECDHVQKQPFYEEFE